MIVKPSSSILVLCRKVALCQSSGMVHAALNNRDQYFHDVDWKGESNATDLFLCGIRREEDLAAGVREGGGQGTQELNELCRRNAAQAQMRQRKKYAEKYFMRNRMLWDNTSGCSRISYPQKTLRTY